MSYHNNWYPCLSKEIYYAKIRFIIIINTTIIVLVSGEEDVSYENQALWGVANKFEC